MNHKQIEADLAVVKRIMEESRQNFYNIGINLIVWGAIVIACLLLTYINFKVIYITPDYLFWVIGFGSGWLFEFGLFLKHRRKKHIIQPMNKVGSTLWMSILITMIIYGIVGVGNGMIQPDVLSAVIAGLLAIGYLVMGESLKIKWVKYLGLGWWVGSFCLFFFKGEVTILIMAGLMFLLQLIPGIVLYKKRQTCDRI